MGERGYGFESRLIPPVEALRRIRPRSQIVWEPGVDLTGVAIPIDFRSDALPPGDHSWHGTLDVPEDGDYTFMVQPQLDASSQGGGSILLDGRQVARTGGPGFGGTGMMPRRWSSLIPTRDGRDNGRGNPIALKRGTHRLDITANSIGEGPLNVRFSWITPAARRAGIDAAVSAARRAGTVVVFAWREAGPSFGLSEAQDELIERVAATNPRTTVVLNTGGPVAMPWLNKVGAIIELWYPGQEGGWAIADVLLGIQNPSGKLPVTFPARLDDAPARAAGHPERLAEQATPGMSGTNLNAPATIFSEGIAVGYRWYDRENIEPLFPFGYGLSYTHFGYSDLTVVPTESGFDVTFRIHNTGGRRGAEAAQVYVGPPAPAPVSMVPKSLVGFQKVALKPGKSGLVTIHIDERHLSFWSTAQHDWVLPAGQRPVYVGSSSRDFRLTGVLVVTKREQRESVGAPHSR